MRLFRTSGPTPRVGRVSARVEGTLKSDAPATLDVRLERTVSDGAPLWIGTVRPAEDTGTSDDAPAHADDEMAQTERLIGLGRWVWNLETGVAEISEGLADIFGVQPDEVTTDFNTFLERVHPDDRAKIAEGSRDALAGHPISAVRMRVLHPDGEIRHVITAGQVTSTDSGRPRRMTGIMYDLTEQHEALQALRHNEDMLSQEQRVALLASWHWDLRDQTMTWSDEHYRMLGYEPGEIEPTFEAFFARVHPEDRDKVQGLVSGIAGGDGFSSVVVRLVLPDGAVRHIRASLNVDADAAGTPVSAIGTAMDITAEVEATESLRQNEERFSSAFYASPDSILITRMSDGRILDVNETYLRRNGLKREDIVGKTTGDLKGWRTPEDRERFITKLRADGEVREMEFELSRADGTSETALISARLIEIEGENCAITTVRDISDLKEASEALRLSEEKFSTAFRAGPVSISISRAADGKILEINESFTALTGYSAEEALSKNLAQLLGAPPEREAYVARMRERGRIDGIEATIVHKDGSRRVITGSVRFVKIGDEDCFLSMMADITARNQAENALRESESFVRTVIDNIPAPFSSRIRMGPTASSTRR